MSNTEILAGNILTFGHAIYLLMLAVSAIGAFFIATALLFIAADHYNRPAPQIRESSINFVARILARYI